MQARGKDLALIAVALTAAASIGVLAWDRVEYRLDLHSVLEIWSDLVRDVEHLPLTVTRMSGAEEAALGDKIHESLMHSRRLGSQKERRYVAAVGRTVAAHAQRTEIDYRFHVIEDATINAYALLGGHVYVTTGMLAFVETEAELAAVIGHEISHVDLRHCVEKFQYERAAAKVVGDDLAGLLRIGRRLFELGFSEQQEVEADAGGMLMMAAAKYDPGAAVDVERKLAQRHLSSRRRDPPRTGTMTGEIGRAVVGALGEYFRTHPSGELRVNAVHAEYSKNAFGWRKRLFYTGRANHEARTSRGSEEFEDEWTALRTPEEVLAPRRVPPPDESAAPVADAGGDHRPDPRSPMPPVGGPRYPVLAWGTLVFDASVHRRPDFSADVVGRLEAGERVYVVARVNRQMWLQIAVPRRRLHEAYTPDSNLREAVPMPAPGEQDGPLEVRRLERRPVNRWNRVAVPGAIRSQPRIDAPVIAATRSGDDVFVHDRLTGSYWVHVRPYVRGSRTDGYLESWTLKDSVLPPSGPSAAPAPERTPTPPGRPQADEIVVDRWYAMALTANVRIAPDWGAAVVGVAQRGADVYVMAHASPGSRWLEVRLLQDGEALEGYLDAAFLMNPEDLPRDAAETNSKLVLELVGKWTRSAKSAYVRAGPGEATAATSYLEARRRVLVIARVEGTEWRFVEHHVQGSALKGYVRADVLQDPFRPWD